PKDLALFATTAGGDLLLVAREGDVLDLGLGQPVQLKDIALYTGSGGQDGLPRSLNDEGQLAFTATLQQRNHPRRRRDAPGPAADPQRGPGAHGAGAVTAG